MKKEDKDPILEFSEQGVTEYFVCPDVVIAENGIGKPKIDILTLIEQKENSTVNRVGVDNSGVPASNIRFSLLYNDLQSPLLAAGSCTGFPSFLHRVRIRTNEAKYNIEQGFYAAMNMMDKQVEFNYFHMNSLKIGDTEIYYVGEP